MILLFVLTLVASFVIVRIGAIGFQLTGLEWSLAKFQSLSCFTGTGFTTREAELVTGNKQRRQIATFLIILGHAGFVTLVATFAGSLMPAQSVAEKIEKPFLPFSLPTSLVPLLNLAILVVSVYVIYRIFSSRKYVGKLTKLLRKKIVKRELFKRVSFEELLVATGGYGISRVKVSERSSVVGQGLGELQLRQHGITVLAIIRGDETLPNPAAQNKLSVEDELICFGRLEDIKEKIC